VTASLKYATANHTSVAVTFDLFGTLVAVDRPDDPAAAVADELAARGVVVPDAWPRAYRRPHHDIAAGEELSLVAHAHAALADCGARVERSVVASAVRAAFDPDEVAVRDGAATAVGAARDHGPTGVLSNCSVPGLVEQMLDRSGLADTVDTTVTSVGCGYRKPDRRAFERVADALGVDPRTLIHVGDDPETDGGVEAVGGRFVSVTRTPLSELPDVLEGSP